MTKYDITELKLILNIIIWTSSWQVSTEGRWWWQRRLRQNNWLSGRLSSSARPRSCPRSVWGSSQPSSTSPPPGCGCGCGWPPLAEMGEISQCLWPGSPPPLSSWWWWGVSSSSSRSAQAKQAWSCCSCSALSAESQQCRQHCWWWSGVSGPGCCCRKGQHSKVWAPCSGLMFPLVRCKLSSFSRALHGTVTSPGARHDAINVSRGYSEGGGGVSRHQ